MSHQKPSSFKVSIKEGIRRDFERENEEGAYAGGRLAGFRMDR